MSTDNDNPNQLNQASESGTACPQPAVPEPTVPQPAMQQAADVRPRPQKAAVLPEIVPTRAGRPFQPGDRAETGCAPADRRSLAAASAAAVGRNCREKLHGSLRGSHGTPGNHLPRGHGGLAGLAGR